MAAPATANTRLRHGDVAARRFPLVPRPKLPCRALAHRIDRVAQLADQARQGVGQPLTRAAEACNLAALIASDCGMPGLARDLCWRQYGVFAQARIRDEATAKLALQPLINLARLHIRDGDVGYQLLESLLDAVRSSRPHLAAGNLAVSLAALALPGDHHKAIVQWLWTVLLSDGLRALCRAGRWPEALGHARQHSGIGQRLFDGRQIAVLAHCASGRHDEARQILCQATVTEAWEHAVAACLHAINRAPGDSASTPGAATHMTGAFPTVDDSGHVMFSTQLGLTIAELSDDGHESQHAVIDKVTRIATRLLTPTLLEKCSPARPQPSSLPRPGQCCAAWSAKPALGTRCQQRSYSSSPAPPPRQKLLSRLHLPRTRRPPPGTGTCRRPIRSDQGTDRERLHLLPRTRRPLPHRLVWHPRLGCWLPCGRSLGKPLVGKSSVDFSDGAGCVNSLLARDDAQHAAGAGVAPPRHGSNTTPGSTRPGTVGQTIRTVRRPGCSRSRRYRSLDLDGEPAFVTPPGPPVPGADAFQP